MGCGGSLPFSAEPSLRLDSEAFAQAAEKARAGEVLRVNLVGWARPSEFLIESPFGGGPGLTALLTAHYTEAGLFSGTSEVLFSAKAAVSFRMEIRGAAETVLVDVSEASRWQFGKRTLNLVNTENDIDRTGAGNMMMSGGRPGWRSFAVERPDGVTWWQTFNQGKDPPELIQSTGRMLGRSRFVLEYWLRAGDPVAVLGSLRTSEDGGLLLVAAGKGFITNRTSQSKALGELGQHAGGSCDSSAFTKLKMTDERCRAGVREQA